MKIAVLVSGGVDSSVALKLLKDQGHELTAYYIKIWLEDDLAFLGDCPWDEDIKYVRAICESNDIPLEIVSMQREYWDYVVQYTIDEVKAGRTPNPDLFCNQRIKFGKFYEHIGDKYDRVATGHYARMVEEDGVAYLKMAEDSWKDQTYFLAHLSQEQIQRVMFPIGDFPKAKVRELAEQYQLPNSRRKDSQGICFLGTIKFSDFIKFHLGEKVGDLIEFESNEKKGEHKGYWFYTIGQRQGLGLSGGPWYVVEKNSETNTVFISRNYNALDKKRDIVFVENPNWISGFEPKIGETHSLRVKIRHGPNSYQSDVTFTEVGKATIKLESADQGLAPGQFVVFYDKDTCLGCAVITGSELT